MDVALRDIENEYLVLGEGHNMFSKRKEAGLKPSNLRVVVDVRLAIARYFGETISSPKQLI